MIKFKTNPRKQMVRDKFPRRVRRLATVPVFYFKILEIKFTSTDDTEIYLLAFLKLNRRRTAGYIQDL